MGHRAGIGILPITNCVYSNTAFRNWADNHRKGPWINKGPYKLQKLIFHWSLDHCKFPLWLLGPSSILLSQKLASIETISGNIQKVWILIFPQHTVTLRKAWGKKAWGKICNVCLWQHCKNPSPEGLAALQSRESESVCREWVNGHECPLWQLKSGCWPSDLVFILLLLLLLLSAVYMKQYSSRMPTFSFIITPWSLGLWGGTLLDPAILIARVTLPHLTVELVHSKQPVALPQWLVGEWEPMGLFPLLAATPRGKRKWKKAHRNQEEKLLPLLCCTESFLHPLLQRPNIVPDGKGEMIT